MPRTTEISRNNTEQRQSRTVSRREDRDPRRSPVSRRRSRNRSNVQESYRGASRRDNNRINSRRRSRSRNRSPARHSIRRSGGRTPNRSRNRSPIRRHSSRRSARRTPNRSRIEYRSRGLVSRSRVDNHYDRRNRESPIRQDHQYRNRSRERQNREENPFRLQLGRSAPAGHEYKFPTNPSGSFAQAMSSIACNAESKAQGIFSGVSGNAIDNFRDEITQALALKLNFKTTRQANEKALRSMVQSKCSATDLRQTLQGRAALYGDLLDTS